MIKMNEIQLSLDDLFRDIEFPRFTAKAGATYPPYNIIEISKNEIVIELALAGFKKEDISIVEKNRFLVVSGEKTDKSDIAKYLYKGIGARSFKKSFNLDANESVSGAEFNDGILSIFVLKSPKQEEEKTISISAKGSDRIYLTERDDIV